MPICGIRIVQTQQNGKIARIFLPLYDHLRKMEINPFLLERNIFQRYKEWSHCSRREIGTSIIEEFSRKREKENRKKETISTNNDGNEDTKENIKEEKDVTSFEM